jgi:acetyltransferase-like isoleucine patch superfamily enzyme
MAYTPYLELKALAVVPFPTPMKPINIILSLFCILSPLADSAILFVSRANYRIFCTMWVIIAHKCVAEGVQSMDGGLIIPYRGIEPKIGEGSWVAPGASVIGDVELGRECSVWFSTVIRGDVHRIRIGDRCNIQDLRIKKCTLNT